MSWQRQLAHPDAQGCGGHRPPAGPRCVPRSLALPCLGPGLVAAARRAWARRSVWRDSCVIPGPGPLPSPPHQALGFVLVTTTLSRLMPPARAVCLSRAGSNSEIRSSLAHQSSGSQCCRDTRASSWVPDAIAVGTGLPSATAMSQGRARWSGWRTAWGISCRAAHQPPAPRPPRTLHTLVGTRFVQRSRGSVKVKFCTRKQTSTHTPQSQQH